MEKSEIKHQTTVNKSTTSTLPCISIYVEPSEDSNHTTSKLCNEGTATNESRETTATAESKLKNEEETIKKDGAKEEEEEKSVKMMKCKSMQNMRLQGAAAAALILDDRYRQNLTQFNNTHSPLVAASAANNQFHIPVKLVDSSSSSSSNRLRHAVNYRKCLSRVNLNLYQNENSSIVHSSSQHEPDVCSQKPVVVLKNNKLVKLNPIRGAKVIYINHLYYNV